MRRVGTLSGHPIVEGIMPDRHLSYVPGFYTFVQKRGAQAAQCGGTVARVFSVAQRCADSFPLHRRGCPERCFWFLNLTPEESDDSFPDRPERGVL